jgi:menaquinone-dependent protoporphyrinogen oxidase
MKKVAIIYASKHKTTKKISVLIADILELKGKFEVAIISLSKMPKPKIEKYDIVILGTPIYIGIPLKAMTNFCKENLSVLITKTLGLFVCGMENNENNRQKELNDAYNPVLHENAIVEKYIGGEIIFNKLNPAEQILVEKYLPEEKKSKTSINIDSIEMFAEAFLPNTAV